MTCLARLIQLLCLVSVTATAGEPYQDTSLAPDKRADDILKRLTMAEKIDYLSGTDGIYMKGIEKLGIPRIKMTDGPLGARCWGNATAYPASINSAATWDVELVKRLGVALGRDCRARGVHILLAPGVNIHRDPRCGRNFEYAGEDPFLAGHIAAAQIRGIQSQEVMATIKHLAANNQETGRHSFDMQVDERSLREIYLPAFKIAIQEGKSACAMTAYNKLNGVFCAEDPWLCQQIIRKEWGFNGILMSDWFGVQSTVPTITNGGDLEMPNNKWLNSKTLEPALANGSVKPSDIDLRVHRLLRTIIAWGFLDRPQQRDDIPKDDPTSVETALQASRGGCVLLKNNGGILPLASSVTKIAVIGPNAHPAVIGGGGSSLTTPFRAVSVLSGLGNLRPQAAVTHQVGEVNLEKLAASSVYDGPITQMLYPNKLLQGDPKVTRTVKDISITPHHAPAPGIAGGNWSSRWTAKIKATTTGLYTFTVRSDDGMRVIMDGAPILEDWVAHSSARTKTATVKLVAGVQHSLTVEYFQNSGGAIAYFGWGSAEDPSADAVAAVKAAVDAAKAADAVVMCVGFNDKTESENSHYGSDRTYELPTGQADLIRAVSAANPCTVVVLTAGGATDWEGWLGQVPALLHCWYPGQEGGTAIAEILYGLVNPSGKLPITIGKKLSDNPSAVAFLDEADNKAKRARYPEGIFVGYRGYDHKGTEPLFCFGHGLSYTTFAYDKLTVAPAAEGTLSVTFTVKNTGKMQGAEVAQVYVAPPTGSVPRPPRELKGFAKVALAPGESKEVTVILASDAFAYWHPTEKAWTIDAGTYKVEVGASSRDLRLAVPVEAPAVEDEIPMAPALPVEDPNR